MSLQLDTARGVLWSGVQSWGSRVISFAVFVVLARLVSPEAFGLIALANVYVLFIQIFAEQGFGTAIEQRHSIEPEHLSSAFWCCLGFALVIAFVTIFLASPISGLFGQPELVPILRVLSLCIVFSAVSGVHLAILRRQLNFKAVAGCTVVANILGGVVGIGMGVTGFGVWALVNLQITYSLVSTVLFWRATKWRPDLIVSVAHFRDLFSFGVSITGSQVLDFFNRRFDQLLIGYYLGPIMLGYYSVAYRLLLILTELLTGVINQVALPVFSRLQGEPERMRRAFYTGVQITGVVAFPIFTALGLLAPQLVTTVFGEKWLPAVPVIQILSIVGVFHSVIWFNGTVTIAMGKPNWRLALLGGRTVVTLIAFTLAVKYGIVAVAAAYVVISYLFAPLEHWIVQRLIGIDIAAYCRQLRAPVVGCVVMASVIFGSTSAMDELVGPRILLPITAILALLSYLVTIFIVSRDALRQMLDLVTRCFRLDPTHA